MFAWEAYEKGADVHLQADPTKLELLSKEFKNRRDQFKKSVKDSVLEHYGGLEHMEDAPPKQLLLAQTVRVCWSFVPVFPERAWRLCSMCLFLQHHCWGEEEMR